MTTDANLPALLTAGQTAADQAAALAQTVAAHVQATPVDSPERCAWAANVVRELRAQRKAFEAERDTVAKPLRKIATDHASRWNRSIKLLEQLERQLSNAILAQQRVEQERQAAALREATSVQEVQAAVAVLAPAPAGVHQRAWWSFEIVDASLIPREFLIVDERKIEALAREQGEALQIPGIRAVRKSIGVVR